MKNIRKCQKILLKLEDFVFLDTECDCGETIRACHLLLLASKLISPLAVQQHFVFFVLVTRGSVWAKIQGVLKKAHRDTPPLPSKHTRTHSQPQTQSQN